MTCPEPERRRIRQPRRRWAELRGGTHRRSRAVAYPNGVRVHAIVRERQGGRGVRRCRRPIRVPLPRRSLFALALVRARLPMATRERLAVHVRTGIIVLVALVLLVLALR